MEKVSGFVSKEPTVALRHLCLYVSVSTVEKLNLKKFKRVRFSVLKNETFENAEKSADPDFLGFESRRAGCHRPTTA